MNQLKQVKYSSQELNEWWNDLSVRAKRGVRAMADRVAVDWMFEHYDSTNLGSLKKGSVLHSMEKEIIGEGK